MAILSQLKRALTGQRSTHKIDVVTFTRLDYWTMLELFDRIPLDDLVRLNELASWWSGYVDKVCLTKRWIAVHCGFKADRSIMDGDSKDSVKVVTIDSTISDRLGNLLPSIKTLVLFLGDSQPCSLSDVNYLISQWSHQLVGLKLEFDFTFVSKDVANYENAQFYGLLLSLNRITTLRRLSIYSESEQCGLKDTIHLPILSQLEYFYFYSGEDDFTNLRDSLVQYAGPNDALKKIDLPTFVWFNHMDDDWELLEQQQLFSKFTIVSISNATRAEWALFPNLNFAQHFLILNSRSRFMESISEMQLNLRAHTLFLVFCISTGFKRNSDQVLANPPPLQSITKLELTIMASEMHTNLYSSFKSLKVNLKMFPNVQAVHLKYQFLHLSSSALKRVFMIWRKISMSISYRILKRRIQRDFPNVKCTFEQSVIDVRDRAEAAYYEAVFIN